MLKESSSGISRLWKVEKANEPFYSGGKTQISADEKLLVCVYDENLRVVDWEKGVIISSIFDPDDDSNEAVMCFCLHPLGETLTLATRKGLLKQYRLSDRQCSQIIRGHSMPVLTMAYDPSGTLVATGSADRTVKVWDMDRGYCTHSFKEHTDIVQRVSFHPNRHNLTLYSTSDDSTIRVYDLVDRKCTACFREHMSLPTAIALSPDGYIMASVGRDKVLNFYELRNLVHTKTVATMDVLEGIVFLSREHARGLLNCAGSSATSSSSSAKGGKGAGIVSEDIRVAVAAGEKGIFRIFKVELKGKDVSTFSCSVLACVAVTPRIAEHVVDPVTTPSPRVPKLTSTTGTAQATLSLQSCQSVSGMHYLPAAGELVVATSDHCLCSFKIGEKFGDSFLQQSRQIVGSNDDILDMVYVPSVDDGTASTPSTNPKHTLALATNSSQVRLIDEDFTCRSLNGHSDIVLAVDVSPDGQWLASSSKDRTCRVWRVRDGACVGLAQGHVDAVGCVALSQRHAAYSTKLAFMVSGAGDKILKRWPLPIHLFDAIADLPTPLQQTSTMTMMKMSTSHNVRAHDKDINTTAVSPNDAMVATGSQDKTVRLWRSTDLSPLATLSGHKRGVWRVAFSPVDRCLASASGDRTLRLWSVVDFSCLRTFEGHTGSVLSVCFVNKGMQLLSGSADGLVRLWTIRTGECENTFEAHGDKVWALAVPVASAAAIVGADEEKSEADGEAKKKSTSDGGGDDEAEKDEAAEEKGLGGGLGVFFSGGSDARLVVWRDATEEEERDRLEALERDMLIEQQLHNDVRNKRYDKALKAALELGHSHRVLTILTAILEEEPDEVSKIALFPPRLRDGSDVGEDGVGVAMVDRLDEHIAVMTDEQVEKIVSYMKEWNTNARFCFVSNVVTNSLLRVCGVERLGLIRSVVEALPGLVAYTERHFLRVQRLYQGTYLADYLTSLMSLLPSVEQKNVLLKTDGPPDGRAEKKRKVDEWDELPVLFADDAPVEKASKSSKFRKQKKSSSATAS